jgi:hypothetical protein
MFLLFHFLTETTQNEHKSNSLSRKKIKGTMSVCLVVNVSIAFHMFHCFNFERVFTMLYQLRNLFIIDIVDDN